VADAESARAGVAVAEDAFGPLDILVNNAGTDRFAFFVNTDEALWDFVLGVNLRGTIAVTHAVLEDMQGRGRGAIVNVASEAGRVGSQGSAVYSAAKAGVIGFTRALAREVGPDNINVNVVLPGLTLSDTQLATSKAGYLNDAYNEQRALKRAQYPEDLVGTVMYLLSNASDFVTGQSFNVDGGKVMH
jgi:2-hydroxycyclohexanecarboxyl-CoA dehydrogenase